MASTNVCVLGLGAMGSQMALRLREQKHAVVVCDMMPERAQALVADNADGLFTAAPTAAEAMAKCSDTALVLVSLPDTACVVQLVRSEGFGAALGERTLANLTSANADDARTIAQVVEEISGGRATYLDGAYCGNPTKVRAGAGQIFLSHAPGRAASPEQLRVLGELGAVSLCGNFGTSRAIDYAVVDLFFSCVLSFMSNAAALEREGVDMKQFFGEAAKRLATVPGALEMYSKRMESRDEAAYNENITVTLATSRNFWASRLPYNEAHGIPSDFATFYAKLLEDASHAPGTGTGLGPHANADLSRFQETVRYGGAAASSSNAPPNQ